MPTWNRFIGTAFAQPQVDHFVPANIEIGDIFKLTRNNKVVQYAAVEATVSDVVAGVLAAFLDSLNGEFRELTPTAGDGYLIVTGPADGAPFTLTSSASNGGVLAVVVTTIVTGTAGTNEQQRVTIGGVPTGGTFTLTFSGQTTGAVAYNASAATLTTALEALSNIAPGDVVVTKNGLGDYTIEFAGVYAAMDVPLLTGSGASITGACSVSVTTTTQGSGGTNEVQGLVLNQNPGGGLANLTSGFIFSLAFGGYETTLLSTDSSATAVQAALQALPSIGAGGVTVSGTPATAFVITFTGPLAHTNVALITNSKGGADIVTGRNGEGDQNNLGAGFVTISEVIPGSSTPINEVQVVTLVGTPTGGTFTLTFQGQTTAGIAYNAATGAVVSALEALSNIGVNDVAVSGSAGGPYTVTFQTALAGTDVLQMTGSGASLTGAAVTAATTQTFVAAANEQQQVELTGSPTGGTFALTFATETTGAIAYNASAATVQAAIEGLATPVPGDVLVTGAAGGPWIVEFKGAYLHTDVAAMTGDASSLTSVGSQTFTKSAITVPTGPHHFDNANNWSLGHVLLDTEYMLATDNDVSIKYGLSNSAITPSAIYRDASFTGDIGLPEFNVTWQYYEDRLRFLTLGNSGDATTINVFIGRGAGGSNALALFDFGTSKYIANVYDAGDPGSGLVAPTVQFLGSHVDNEININKGLIGVAYAETQTAVVKTLRMSYRDAVDDDANVIMGPGVTLGTVEKLGGNLEINCAIVTLLHQIAGETTIQGEGAVAQITGEGGTIFYNTIGTLGGNTILSGNCILNLDQDLRAKTTTNPIDIYGDEANVQDAAKVLSDNGAVGTLTMDMNFTTRNPTLGRNYRLQRKATA